MAQPIPPRGFTNANYETFGGEPVAHSYSDGQFWDVTTYGLPDCNDNTKPDWCETIAAGDFDLDGDVDLMDFRPFQSGFTN